MISTKNCFDKKMTGSIVGAALIGAAIFLIGLFFDSERAWANLFLVSFYLIGIGLAGLVFIALEYVCSAGWSTCFRRVPEAMTGILPIAGIGIMLCLVLNSSGYAWTHWGDVDAGGALKHHLPETYWMKEWWLQNPFFVIRAIIYILIWIFFAKLIVGVSRKQDEVGGTELTLKNKKYSAFFLVFFAFTCWLASYDWIMSLEPEWFSTIFGVYNFAGMLQSGFAFIIVALIYLKKKNILPGVTEEHFHDLGRYLFGFSCFWMYMWVSQYLLIWYTDMPEETSYYLRRYEGGWHFIFFLNIFLNWVIPFVCLLSRKTKRNYDLLGIIAVVILGGRWLDIYQMVFPPLVSSAKANPVFGILEAGIAMGALALLALVFLKTFQNAKPEPIKDPYLEESLHHHV